jgi:hypothetical protein
MLARVVAALLILAAPLPAAAQERPGLDAYERLNLPPGRAGRTARRDLEAMFGPEGDYVYDFRVSGVNVNGHLFTRPVPTRWEGLCRRVMLVIVNEQIPGTATPHRGNRIRPVGLETHTQFRVIDDERAFRPRRPNDDRCLHSDPRIGRGWFFADNAEVARRGYLAILRAAAAIREGRITATGCDDRARCAEAVLSAADRENLRDVSACPDGREEYCYLIASPDHVVRVQLAGVYGVEEVESITVSWFTHIM